MKKVIGLFIGFLLTVILAIAAWYISEKLFESSQRTKSVTLTPKQKLTAPAGGAIYEVTDNEAIVHEELIDRILIGKNVTITYRNKTVKPIVPVFRIRFYDSYGLMVASKKIGEENLKKNNMLGAGEVGSDVFSLETLSTAEIFEYSNLRLSEGVSSKIKWILISDINHTPSDIVPLK